ncbi:MAG: magnesium chelatase domain-containing protein [Thermoguttaceae bacterium]
MPWVATARSLATGGYFFFAQGGAIAAVWLLKTQRVGLPEAAVKESTHRVERAIVNSGFQRPHNRVTINLAPACSRL